MNNYSNRISRPAFIMNNGSQSVNNEDVYIKIIWEEKKFQKVFQMKIFQTVRELKVKLFSELKLLDKDYLNFGFYQPIINGRCAKFLKEERYLEEYPSNGEICVVYFKHKSRIYKEEISPINLKKVNSKQKKAKVNRYISHCKLRKLDKWLNKGGDPNFWSRSTGETPLTVSVTCSQLLEKDKVREVITMLINAGAHLEFCARDSQTALHKAADIGNIVAIQILLHLGLSSNYMDLCGLTPLYYATKNVNVPCKCLEMLLYEHAVLGCRDKSGLQEIHQVCLYPKPIGNTEVNQQTRKLKVLLAYGANVNSQIMPPSSLNEETTTLVDDTVSGKSKVTFKMNLPATCDTLDIQIGDTPLHLCAKRNNEEMIKVLLKAGADLLTVNQDNETAYNCALKLGYHDLAANFLKDGLSIPNAECVTCLDSELNAPIVASVNPNHFLPYAEKCKRLNAMTRAVSNGYNLQSTNSVSNERQFPHSNYDKFSTSSHSDSGENYDAKKWKSGVLLLTPAETQAVTKSIMMQSTNNKFGLAISSLDENLSSSFQLSVDNPSMHRIKSVERDSIADKCGIKVGDYLLEVNGYDVTLWLHDDVLQIMYSSPEYFLKMLLLSANFRMLIYKSTLRNDTNITAVGTSTLVPHNRIDTTTTKTIDLLNNTLNSYDQKLESTSFSTSNRHTTYLTRQNATAFTSQTNLQIAESENNDQDPVIPPPPMPARPVTFYGYSYTNPTALVKRVSTESSTNTNDKDPAEDMLSQHEANLKAVIARRRMLMEGKYPNSAAKVDHVDNIYKKQNSLTNVVSTISENVQDSKKEAVTALPQEQIHANAANQDRKKSFEEAKRPSTSATSPTAQVAKKPSIIRDNRGSIFFGIPKD